MASYISRTGNFYDPDQKKRNLLALNDQRNLSQFCDVMLRVSNTHIYAHSNVLAAASPYFESFLGIGADCPRMFSQKHPQIIEIHIDTKDEDNGYGEAVSKVVEFMYTSHITLTPTLVFQVVEIGKIMQMDKLIEFCELFQSGEDSNFPRDIATCTTGLQEIAHLLGSRSRTIKQVSIATETEDRMFKKIESSNPTVISSAIPTVISSAVPTVISSAVPTVISSAVPTVISSAVPLPSSEVCSPNDTKISLSSDPTVLPSVTIKNESEAAGQESETSDIPDTQTVGFDTDSIDQNDASLLLAISNVRPPVILTHSETDRSSNEQRNSNPEQLISSNSSENSITMGGLNSSHVINLEFDKSTVEPNNAMQVESPCTFSDLPAPEEFVQNNEHKNKDFNLDDISDLLTFDSVTTALFQSSRGNGRGRPRGRGRGRGRGRRPGRPRKMKEEPDSDPEFEAFINRVENGDNAVSVDAEDEKIVAEELSCDTASANDKSSVTSEKGTEGNRISLNWKSRRRRSKPSQLRKDYVMHSLTKKSRRQHEASRSEELWPLDTKYQTEDTVSTLTNVKLVCQKCDFATINFKEYRQHMKMHPETDPRYFLCEKCQFKTTKSREFNAHKHKHMKDELICSFCAHQSETTHEFAEHSQKHAGDFPYFCTECDSRFKTKNQLIAHKPKHQLEKPFVCAICNSGFKWKHALKNHVITHSATKDHLCDVCGYATAHKSQLKAHKLIHTGHMFKCPVSGCHFEATKRQNLKYHMVTHTREKPHQCDICGQSFSLIKNMRRHMLLHTDTRPFTCKICSFSTTRYDKLKEHNVKLHSIDPPISKKEIHIGKDCEVESVRMINSNITYVSPDGITINTDGAFTEETLQTIAQLASAQSLGSAGLQSTTINIEQTAEDGTVYPIIATVQSFSDSGGEVQFITEVAD